MFLSKLLLFVTFTTSAVNAFTLSSNNGARVNSLLKGAESEVSFGNLDGSDARIGIIRTRWNDEHVTNLVDGAKKALKECNVKDENIFETEVPGSFELPLAAKFLAMSGTVDAIICAGVLIKGDTMHFEYISDAVAKGIMNVGVNTNLPIVFGVLTCLNEEQVQKRSSGDNNHGYDWGKTAVEMALLRLDALGAVGKPTGMGFSSPTPLKTSVSVAAPNESEKRKVGFYNEPVAPVRSPTPTRAQPPARPTVPVVQARPNAPLQGFPQQPMQSRPQQPIQARPQQPRLSRPQAQTMPSVPLGGTQRRVPKQKKGFSWSD